jgi:putative endonuclease
LTGRHKPDPAPDAARRLWAEQLGRLAKVIVIIWLCIQFYFIQAWRWKCPSGEVDLIARRGQRLLFIEVKFRSRSGDAAAAYLTKSLMAV